MSEMESRVGILETKMEEMSEAVHAMRADVKAIRSWIDQAKGGKKMIVVIFGALGAIASLAWVVRIAVKLFGNGH